MNWGKVLLTGLVGGIVVNIYEFIMHGMIMRGTYESYEVFAREPASPLWFVLLAVIIGIAGAMIFAKTRAAWGPGTKGGLVFGAFVGIIAFFAQFYYPLTIAGFPYYLAWCWGGIAFIGWLVFGAVASFFIKEQPV